jgi:hypothetical protein
MHALYKFLGIENELTTIYHPEINGKIECKNQCQERMLNRRGRCKE